MLWLKIRHTRLFESIPVLVIPRRVEKGRGGTHRRVYTVTHGEQVERRLSKGRWHGYKPRPNELIVPIERTKESDKKKKIPFKGEEG